MDEILAKACPEKVAYSLGREELAVFRVVAAHYKKFQSSVAERQRMKISVSVEYDRHAVASLAAPQLLFLDTIVSTPMVEQAVRLELERHGVESLLSGQLAERLRTRNRESVRLKDLRDPSIVTLTCADRLGAFFGRRPSAGGNLTNAEKMITIMLPAFDASKTRALILANNEFEEKGGPGAEVLLLRRNDAGAWTIEWDADIASDVSFHTRLTGQPQPSTPDATDTAIIDAMMLHLAKARSSAVKGFGLVNQTRLMRAVDSPSQASTLAMPPELMSDLVRRNSASVFLGKLLAGRPFALVPRETLRGGTRAGVLGSRSAVVQVTLPGFGRDGSATIGYTIATPAEAGFDIGYGLALLEKRNGVWRVTNDAYQRSIRFPG